MDSRKPPVKSWDLGEYALRLAIHDTVEVWEFWSRDPRNPYGWCDRWIEVPEHEVRYGFAYPMVREWG